MFHLKLAAPRLPSSVVHRSRLITALEAVSPSRLILLTAPAGYGKTTLLSQWCKHLVQDGERVGWLTLDESDADVRRFMIGVIRSLEVSGILMPGLGDQADGGLMEVSLDGVVREIHARLQESGPTTLILDDYHRVACQPLDEFLGGWIPSLPDGVRVLMSTRRRPDIVLHRLFGSGEAVEITSDMLRFNRMEAREVLDVGLGDAERDALVERTEGWPVALQLTRLISLQGQTAPLTPSRLVMRGGQLWTFLSDQVLRGLGTEAVDFLLETSILERFSTEITDAVRGRTDGWQIMEQLVPLQSLLAPIDDNATWFRYHHLFAEYLQAQLRQRRPTAITALHLRASVAFEQAGLLAEAVRHASLAGDYARCAELVEQAGGWRLVLYGGMGQLRHLLDFIPPAKRLSHPRLLIAEAYLKLKIGHVREARSTFELVSKDMPALARNWIELSDYERDILNIGVLIRTYEDNTVDLPFLDSFESLQEPFLNADGLTRGVLDCARAVANLRFGRLEKAEEIAREAMGEMREVNSVLGLNYCFLHAGVASTYRGELQSAVAYLQRAKSMAIENFGADSGLKAIADSLLSMVQLWSDGRLSMTAQALDDAFRDVCDYDGWFEIYAAGLGSRFQLASSARNFDGMARVIADGDCLTQTRGLERLTNPVDAQRLRYLLAIGDRSAAEHLAGRLSGQFPLGGWRTNQALWRPYQDVGYSLANWYLGHDPELARARADDLVASARMIGARAYETRALLLLAHIESSLSHPVEAMHHLRSAIGLAARKGIALPFVEQSQLLPLVRELKRDLWDHAGDPVEAAFLSDIEVRIAEAGEAGESNVVLLSAREQEVMAELSRGLTNKEIARALDMTEHTVKFHLKNIFAKLGVDRRAHALAALKRGSHSTYSNR